MNDPEHIEFEQGRPVPAVDFDYSAMDGLDAGEELQKLILGIKDEAVRRIIGILLDGKADIKEAGMRVHIIAYGLKIHPAKSQRELARVLKISQATVSRKTSSNRKRSSVFKALLRPSVNHSAHR